MDTSAAGDEVGIGGWLPVPRPDGTLCTTDSAWFSARITPRDLPWVFERHGEAYRSIASLELLAVLVAFMVFGPKREPGTEHVVDVCPALTDNKGNGHVLHRMMTTKFPMSAVLMELATRMGQARARVLLQWTPRELNAEADALANGRTGGFDERRRVTVDWAALGQNWLVLNELLTAGAAWQSEAGAAREGQKPMRRGTAGRGRAKRLRLKERDPW